MRRAALLAGASEKQNRGRLSRRLDDQRAGHDRLVEQKVGETMTYYAYSSTHWRQIRTDNPLERLIREIRRRTQVVGAFSEGHSTLMLVPARLRHIASAKWSKGPYLLKRDATSRLPSDKVPENGAADDEHVSCCSPQRSGVIGVSVRHHSRVNQRISHRRRGDPRHE